MKSIYIIVFLFISTCVFSQHPAIDSLQKVLKIQKEDTNKVKTLFRISHLYTSQRDPDQAIEYQKQALLLSEKLKFRLGKAKATFYLGNITRVSFDCHGDGALIHSGIFRDLL